jgi:hypothetical protein
MTDTPALDQRSTALIDEQLWLARHAQQRIELENLGDYWYVLGQRNTYARAAALIAAPHLGEDSAVIGERIVDALTCSAATSRPGDLAQLRAATLGTTDPASTRASSRLEWMGRKAFDARYGDIPGLDRDFGMRWGRAGNQRLSLRRDPHASRDPVGMLYAYDPTWDEYAVISTRAPADAVEAAFAQAVQVDVHMSVPQFAELYASQVLVRIGSVQRHPSRGVEL